jgi:hypothetical protein
MKIKDDETLDLREQLSRLRDDFDELRGQYAALTASGSSKEQQREMGVSLSNSWSAVYLLCSSTGIAGMPGKQQQGTA